MRNLSSESLRPSAPPAADPPQIVTGQKTAWARRPSEGARAYEYARAYVEMGPGRSIAKAAQQFTKSTRPLKRYSRKWNWVTRAAAYDRSMEAKNLEAAETVAEAETQKWAQRKRDQREERSLLGERIIEAGETMLRLPLAEVQWVTQVDADGHEAQIQIIKPVVSARDAVFFTLKGFALTGQAIWYEVAPHSDVAEVDFYECDAPQVAAGQKTAWARRLGEGGRAYQYAWEYFMMGPHRSIEGVAQKFAKNPRPLNRYSVKWQWVKRAAAYDRSIDAEKRKEAEAFAKAEEQESAQRQRDQRERLFRLGERFIETGNTILKFPLAEVRRVTQVDADGHPTQIQIIKPVRWAQRDALLFCDSSARMSAAAIRNERWPCSPMSSAAPRSARHSSRS
jgi:hypothetical protein